MLDELPLRDSYSSDENDLVSEFYNPVLARSVTYDRITGYFSPSILAVAARGFAGLLNNKGKIRILSSVQVSKETYDAINVSENGALDASLTFDMSLLEDELQRDYVKIFMYLYKTGLLELKIAVLRDSAGILHQKIGIVKDAAGNAISFSGSNNETYSGAVNNLEEFKVFKNWTISTSSYFTSDRNKFEKYWSNQVDGVKVVSISDAMKDKLVKIVGSDNDIRDAVRRIQRLEGKGDDGTGKGSSRQLRDYQIKAIEHWVDNNYRSILEMATGTGKTFTAINALRRFREDNSYLRVVIVVPLTTLTVQWQEDIKKIIPDVNTINTSTDGHWKDALNSLIISRELGRDADYVLITTYSMFSKELFGEKLARLGEDIILLADEMHNLVNANRIKALASPVYKYKLGLSATPTRLWQQTESAIARAYFGNNSYQYTLEDAIKNDFLVPYNYHPLPVMLSAEEYEDYVSLSREIGRMSQIKSEDGTSGTALHMKLVARSRIKKNAEGKLVSLERTINQIKEKSQLQNALIYVDNEDYLQKLQAMLTRNDIRTTKFVGSNTLEERLSAIQNLRTHSINAIVAIKCLDEGVDIPSAKVAFFLSNNTDPREYVQRLGRVLRLDSAGDKDHAEIYDYIIMPPSGVAYQNETDRKIARNMIKNELIRSRFFNDLAMNSENAQVIIDDTVDNYGFYFEPDELTYSIGDDDNELTY